MMMTCRLLCALLVLALCCCPSVCSTESEQAPQLDSGLTRTQPEGTGVPGLLTGTLDSSGDVTPESKDPTETVQQQANITGTDVTGAPGASSTVLTGSEKETSEGSSGSGPATPEKPKTESQDPNTEQQNGDTGTRETQSGNIAATDQTAQNGDDSTETSAVNTTNTTTQPPRRPLRQRHQVLRLQRRQPRRPPAHRHVFPKWTAASAAPRGCVPRCCSPYPRWRTPLWAEELCMRAVRVSTQPRGLVPHLFFHNNE
ncbi:mucin TcMUCII, putative [Trypanosoma cruzi marinkellei]|uniref:Mucin TcMUCII, putative n=1 Tax=Trypanosoma cruzi marinkellei TaxID=85056 RepID=K2NRR7_TRYCR|nr:mucin TcMUCII, putative [Trypanosoma cruzi marinkellei]